MDREMHTRVFISSAHFALPPRFPQYYRAAHQSNEVEVVHRRGHNALINGPLMTKSGRQPLALTDFRGYARKELSHFSLDKIFSNFV